MVRIKGLSDQWPMKWSSWWGLLRAFQGGPMDLLHLFYRGEKKEKSVLELTDRVLCIN